ncbi:GNAT family N-acetyltransferase [Edaphobacter aggregans]|uniref:GNAT family N-acetyltransferase n=1 Tax=Edaphobacter aggregans TaxID=570835 RepID=UPI000555B698|nr:GNAT family protein [Edaphobacter aggregans]
MTLPETPVLEGPRVRLEPLSRAHLPALEEVAYDTRIWRYMLTRVTNREELEAWVEAALAARSNGHLPWVTILKAQNGSEEARVVGSTRFLDLDLHHRTVEIGHTWLTPTLHAAGVNPEAKLLQLAYAFETLNLNRVAFKTHHENLQSQAAIKKLGAQYEGTFRNHYVMPDGTLRHTLWYSITREEWPEVKVKLEQRLQLIT